MSVSSARMAGMFIAGMAGIENTAVTAASVTAVPSGWRTVTSIVLSPDGQPCHETLRGRSLQRFHRHIELDGIDDTQPLKLDPHAVDLGPWKHHLELDHRALVHAVRMQMNHVDQVVARREHVRPGAEILLESLARIEPETQLRAIARNRLFRDCLPRHAHVRAGLG